MLRRDAMEPDGIASSANLSVDRVALGVAGNTACFKPKRFDEKVVCRGEIFVHEQRNDTIDVRH